MGEPSFVARVFEYLYALWPTVAAVVGTFSVETCLRVIRRTRWRTKPAVKWLNHPDRRLSLYLAFLLVAVLLGGFEAFDDVSHQLREANRKIAGGADSPYHWQMLSANEARVLRASLEHLHAQAFLIIAGDDGGDLGRSFRDVFKSLDWRGATAASMWGTTEEGIQLWVDATLASENIAAKIERATNGRLKVKTRDPGARLGEGAEVQIYIGSKPNVAR